MKSTDRQRILECSVRKKRIRSDSLKRLGLKHKNFNLQVTTTFKANVKGSGFPSNQDLESEILAYVGREDLVQINLFSPYSVFLRSRNFNSKLILSDEKNHLSKN